MTDWLRGARIAGLAALVGLTGCHPLQKLREVGGSCHDVQPYTKAGSAPPLKIPPGFDVPDNANALHIPELNATPTLPPRGKTDPCLDEPPPFKVAKPNPPAA
jgi:uncharacterized lipoprotein